MRVKGSNHGKYTRFDRQRFGADLFVLDDDSAGKVLMPGVSNFFRHRSPTAIEIGVHA